MKSSLVSEEDLVALFEQRLDRDFVEALKVGPSTLVECVRGGYHFRASTQAVSEALGELLEEDTQAELVAILGMVLLDEQSTAHMLAKKLVEKIALSYAKYYGSDLASLKSGD